MINLGRLRRGPTEVFGRVRGKALVFAPAGVDIFRCASLEQMASALPMGVDAADTVDAVDVVEQRGCG